MHSRILNILLAALFTLILAMGCKSVTPAEATKSAGDETRTLITEHVADEARAKQMIALVDQLEIDLMAFVKTSSSLNSLTLGTL